MVQYFICYLFNFLQVGAILFLSAADGACTWPSDFLYSTWVDSSKGDLVFQTTTLTGWAFTVGNLKLTDWVCHTTEYLDSHGYLVMKTNTTFIQFHTQKFYGYRCLQITKITDASYRYYEIAPIQTANLEYERMIVHDLANPAQPSEVSELCPTDIGASGSEYRLLIKKGFEEQAKIRCPYNTLGKYDYTHTASTGTMTCTGEDKLDMCADDKEMKFDYSTCPTKVAYSASDTVWCVDSVPVGDDNFVTVYNAFDDATDNVNTYRFSCLGFSADGTSASVTPQNCKKDQTPYDVPVNNAGDADGATLTMPATSTLCPPCPVLSNPPKGEVSITTDGAFTIATYKCSNNYTLVGDGTRICQENNTWSEITPSCTCETPTSPTNGAVTVSADGTTATYTCIANFTLDGEVTRTCQTDTNTWTGSAPTCSPCDPLDVLDNGNVMVDLTDVNTVSVAFYTCEAGATLNGVTSRKCLTDGTWTETQPICTSCPTLSGAVNVTTNGTISSATVSCAVGYTVVGEQHLNCLSNGSWDVVEPECVCNSPTVPANGSLTLLEENKMAVYSCDSGFTLNGPSQRICQSDGTGWSGADPECVICHSLPSTEGLHIYISTNQTVSAASFTCDIKYTLRGNSFTYCLPTGDWEYDTPTCEKCTALTPLESGNILFSTNGTSTTANYTCTTGTSLQGQALVECNSDGTWGSGAVSCVECDQLEGLQDGSYVVSSNGITSEVTYACTDGFTLTGSSQAICQENGTWAIASHPYCSRDSSDAAAVMENDPSLLPAVIALAVLTVILISVSSVAIYCYCKVKKANQAKGYSTRDDEIPKSIPIAAVPPSAAPMDHQKPMFEGGRATALSMAPESHRQNSSRNLFSASSSLRTSASISRLNLEMIRETTSSSVYGSGLPAPWSSNKDSIASGSTDLPRLNSPTMSSLYSEYSSPRRGYTQTPRCTDDSEDTGRDSQLTDDNIYYETPSPRKSLRKSPKKRKKALRKLSHADIDEDEPMPSYMRETKASTSKTYQEMILNDNKQSSRISLSVTGNERTGSYRSPPKLTSPRV